MPLSAGDKLGPYEIVSPLGAGGMGEVYKARDTRLDRLVAIKILPHDKTADENRKRRFIQEAKAASALNHPNIIAIYDVGTENGIDFLVMELVSGKSLDQLIPASGMRLGEIFRIGVQIADAFSKAHSAGIVHRDLKPGNVMVTTDGQVKVLDFGLAKLTQREEPKKDATQTLAAHTGDGTVLGTAAYMSPEQAEGKPVDARSDIFSFGSVLYEMSTGQRAFYGDTQMSTISSILRDDPKPPSASREDIPQQLVRVITRCLRKDPARRFQYMADLKVELEDLKEESDSGKLTAALPGAQTSPRHSSGMSLWIGIGFMVVLGGVAGARFWMDKHVISPPLQAVPLTSYTGVEDEPSFSPDGNQVAFRWNGEKEDNFDIYVKLIGSGAPLRLTTDPASDNSPSWSPDGRTIAFERMSAQGRATILTVPPLGGPERKVAEVLLRPGFGSLGGMTWSRDSKSLIVSAVDRPNEPNRLVLISLETGERKILTNPPVPTLVGDGAPALSPDGRTLAFLRETGMNLASLFVMDLASDLTPLGEPRQVATPGLSPTSPTWKQDGLEIVFASGQRNAAVLYSVSASGKSPPALLQGGGAGVGDAAISGTAHRLVYSSFVQNSIIYRTAIDHATSDGKGPSEKFIASSARESFPQFSADGKRITFYSNRSGTVQIWISAADGSSAQQLTDMSGPTTGSPRWSPDGKKISFDSNTGGNWQIYTISPDGGKPQPMTNDIYTNVTSNWSHDGHWIYFASRRSGAMEVWKMPAGGGAAVQVTRNGGTAPVESPDAKWLYYVKDDGAGGLWKMPVDGGAETLVVKLTHRYNFAVLDRGLYYALPRDAGGKSAIQYLDFATGAIKTILPDVPIDLGLAVSPDGRSLLWSQLDHRGSDLMLIDNFH